MSETASSPSVHPHHLSSSSSVSSTDSAPHSEPTSDEQPDLGAFNLILREFSHLQPTPRLPVTRRPPTSSTASVGHDDQSRTGRRAGGRNLDSRTSRLSGRSDISGLSSFTRPASSSAYPEGSTVWAHAAIAPYLMSRTPVSEEYDSYAESYQASDDDGPPGHQHFRSRSPASTEGGRTVEIDSEAEVPSVGSSHRVPYSPHPSVDVEVPVGDGERVLDSRETGRSDDRSEVILRVGPTPETISDQTSSTSRDHLLQPSYPRHSFPNTVGPSYDVRANPQLRPQPRHQTATISSSLSPRHSPPTSSSGATQIPNAPFIPLLPSLSSFHPDSLANSVTTTTQEAASTPPNTLAPSIRSSASSLSSRDLDPVPSPDVSLLSYRLPHTPSVAVVEESDGDAHVDTRPTHRVSTSSASDNPTNTTRSSRASETASTSVSLKTQRSMASVSSTSPSTGTTQTDHRHLAFTALHSRPDFAPLDDNSISNRSGSSISHRSLIISDDMSISSIEGHGFRAQPPSLASVPPSVLSSIEISDRGGAFTPDQPPSETIPFHLSQPSEREYAFSPVRDDDDDEDSVVTGSSARRLHSVLSQDSAIPFGPPPLRLERFVEPPPTSFPHERNDEEDDFSRRYPYTHTPRTHAHVYPSSTLPSTSRTQSSTNPLSHLSAAPQLAPSSLAAVYSRSIASTSNAVITSASVGTSSPSRSHSAAGANTGAVTPLPNPHSPTHAPPTNLTLRRPTPNNTTTNHVNTSLSTIHSQTVQPTLIMGLPVEDTTSIGTTADQHIATSHAPDPSQPTSNTSHDRHPSESSHHHTTRVQPYHPQPPFTLTRGNNFGAGYPYSLLNVHELPHSLPPDVSRATEDWWMRQLQGVPVVAESNDGDDRPVSHPTTNSGGSNQRTDTPEGPEETNGSRDAALEPTGTGALDQTFPPPNTEPSLGYLDTALAFIAAEREKANERVTSASRAIGLMAGGGGDDGEGEEVDGGADNENAKRKRRRRRPKNERSLVGLARSGDLEAIKRLEDMGEEWRSPIFPVSPPASGAMSSSTSKGKRKDKDFLVPARSSANPSDEGRATITASILGTGATTPSNQEFLAPDSRQRPESEDEGAKTPTNKSIHPIVPQATSSTTGSSLLEAIKLTGAKGKRVGRRQREQEKSRRDAMLKMMTGLEASSSNNVDDPASQLFDTPLGPQYAADDDEDEGDDDYDGASDDEDEDDLKDLDILRPPQASSSTKKHRPRRRKKESMAHIHVVPGGGGGVYKSTPGTPRSRAMELSKDDEAASGDESGKFEQGSSGAAPTGLESTTSGSTANLSTSPSKKKKQRTKKSKTSMDIKKGGIIDILDLDRNEFDRVLGLKAGGGDSKGNAKMGGNPRSFLSLSKPGTDDRESSSSGASIALHPSSKRSRIIGLAKKLRQTFPAQRKELDAIVTRFEAPALMASNTVKTAKPKGSEAKTSTKPIPIPNNRKQHRGHLRTGSEGSAFDINDVPVSEDDEKEDQDEDFDPRGPAPRRNDPLIHVFIDHSNILIGLLNHLKRHPPPKALLNPFPGAGPEVPAVKGFTGPSPTALPPLLTDNVARSLPASSFMGRNGRRSKADLDERDAISDEYGYNTEANDGYDSAGPHLFARRTRSKKVRHHLWHAALTLVLERGRSIARRVVVTSSPLYQPMESIEYLGYELRVYMRVPDLGDGMDRERRSGKLSSSSKNAPTASSSTGLTRKGSTKKANMGSGRPNSGNESGSGSGGGGALDAYQAMANGSGGKVKFREQGVDELLQLKLHQSVAAQDRVPEGSTIVLATGDGNVGQFNEDGFLGPVRTALRHGWRVELYAWEDGLSRAWKREFVDNSEWGKKGMFQIIPMEPYAHSLFQVAKSMDEEL